MNDALRLVEKIQIRQVLRECGGKSYKYSYIGDEERCCYFCNLIDWYSSPFYTYENKF